MSIQIVYGTAGTGKSTYIFNHINEQIKQKSPYKIKVIIPEQFSYTAEQKLLEQWEKVLTSAKATKEYNPKLTYGVYQIYSELDISYKDEETGKTVWVYSDLHGHLQTLKSLVKEYYNTEIVPTLFEYEFLK